MLADEAAASISDEDGKLLFYTNGSMVYNKNHQVMLNGDNLDGNISAVQIAIIPMPGNSNLYYIFTTGAIESSFTSGYKYSIVDMSGDNGNGEVTTKNSLLWPSCTERMGTARHANGIDIWLITNDNNSDIFRAWLITCAGIQPAVVSTVGLVMDQHSSTNTGVIKISPDGKFLCQTHFPFFDETLHVPNFIQLFGFNNATGSITNPQKIGFADAQITHCEFSPDSKLLYLTRPADKKIDQLEITLPTLGAIQASRVSFTTDRSYYDIQLAPDEKIYLAKPGQELAVIHRPNIKGAGCNFQQQYLSLLPGSSYLGLTSHINDIVSFDNPDNGFTYTILDSCTGKVQFHGYSILPGTINWAWDFGDGNTSALQDPVHTFIPSGAQYTVKLKVASSSACGTIYKSRIIKPQGVLTGNVSFDFMRKCDSGYVRFRNTSSSVNEPGLQFEWDFGDGNFSSALHPIHTYSLPGNYIVKLKMQTGISCLDASVSQTVNNEVIIVNAPPDQTILVGQTVLLSASGPPGFYNWSPSTWLNNSNTKSPVATPLEDIIYKVTATNNEGCKGEDSIRIKVIQYDEIYVPNGFTPGNDGKNDLLRPFYPGTITLKEFSIFNRWGQLIYSTSRRNEGWNGKVNGELQNPGVYVWILKAENKLGNQIQKKGNFVLIR